MKEARYRGTLQFPFQQYEMSGEKVNIFVTPHWHDEVEIIYLNRGTLSVYISGECYDLVENDILIVNTNMVHHMISEDRDTLYHAYLFPLDYLSFAKKDYAELLYVQPLVENDRVLPTVIGQDKPCYENIKKLVVQLIELDKERSEGYQLLTKSILYQFLYDIYKCELMQKSNKNRKQSVDRIMVEYLEQNYQKHIALEEVADRVNMSKNYFCRYFKQHFGKTFIEYLVQLRIEKACILLEKNRLSVLEVALEVGYSNISYFNKCFKQIVGMTPSRYREIKQKMYDKEKESI